MPNDPKSTKPANKADAWNAEVDAADRKRLEDHLAGIDDGGRLLAAMGRLLDGPDPDASAPSYTVDVEAPSYTDALSHARADLDWLYRNAMESVSRPGLQDGVSTREPRRKTAWARGRLGLVIKTASKHAYAVDDGPPQDVIDAWALNCRCCPHCSEHPCPGCCAGGVCDGATCECDDEQDEPDWNRNDVPGEGADY